jgi:single-strand DNA-binding protein
VVIFNEQIAKVAEQYLKKGMKVYIEGQLQTRKWQDQAGVDKYSTEIVLQSYRGELQMLDSKGGGASTGGGDMEYDQSEPSGFNSGGAKKRVSNGPKENFSADLDDEIPF